MIGSWWFLVCLISSNERLQCQWKKFWTINSISVSLWTWPLLCRCYCVNAIQNTLVHVGTSLQCIENSFELIIWPEFYYFTHWSLGRHEDHDLDIISGIRERIVQISNTKCTTRSDQMICRKLNVRFFRWKDDFRFWETMKTQWHRVQTWINHSRLRVFFWYFAKKNSIR